MNPIKSDSTHLSGLQRLLQSKIMVQVKVICEKFELADPYTTIHMNLTRIDINCFLQSIVLALR